MERWKTIARRHLARFISDRAGGVAVLTAMSLTTLLGFAGLGTEATLWYVAKRNMQGATDAAAFSAATAEAAGQNSTAFDAAANAVAKQYGFAAGTGGVTVAVNNPPLSGNYTTNSEAIEVIVSQPQPMLFSQLFRASEPTITARAVAAPGNNASGCVMALDKGDVIDVSDSGTTTLNLNSCALDINSSSSDALNMSGNTVINTSSANIVGNYVLSGGAQINATSGIQTGTQPVADPYANAQIPSYSGCNKTSLVVVGTTNLTPTSPGGVYVLCNTVTVAGGAGNLNLAPGVYIINAGSLNVSGGATITGTGVTIILTSSSGASYGTVQVGGGSTINISAPTSGATAGIAFFGDRNAPSTNSNSFSGGATQNITGAIYFPSQEVTYSGGRPIHPRRNARSSSPIPSISAATRISTPIAAPRA